MKQRSILLTALAVMFLAVGCNKDENPAAPAPVNEAEVLLSYLEANGDYINTTAPSIIAAADVRTYQLTNPTELYLVDTRSSTDFAAGHIEGAVNISFGNLVSHMKGLTNAAGYDRVVLVCYSGQTAAYGAAFLRLLGYANVYSLKWGMSSWDSVFAQNYWNSKLGNSRATQFTTTATSKNAPGNLPTLSTGKTTGPEILEARVNAVLAAGYSPAATVDHTTLFNNLTGYYIVNYWPAAQYASPGHIPGAVQYEPKSDLKSLTSLKTLPTDKPVVFYCYTGQTSSFVAAYLRLLGYDAKSLLYGANAMIYDQVPASKFVGSEIKGYPYVTGP